MLYNVNVNVEAEFLFAANTCLNNNYTCKSLLCDEVVKTPNIKLMFSRGKKFLLLNIQFINFCTEFHLLLFQWF